MTDPYFGKIYDEDGYCVACGNGKWKSHASYWYTVAAFVAGATNGR